MLLPGTCCTARFNFGKIVPLLAAKYKVIYVDYDGFDGNGSEFTIMIAVTRKIENYIKKRCGGELRGLWFVARRKLCGTARSAR